MGNLILAYGRIVTYKTTCIECELEAVVGWLFHIASSNSNVGGGRGGGFIYMTINLIIFVHIRSNTDSHQNNIFFT